MKLSNSDSGLEKFGKNVVETSPKEGKITSQSAGYPSADPAPKNGKNNDVTALVQWSICGPNTYKPVSFTFPKLEKGIYNIYASQNHGIVFERKTICVDDLLRFPDSVSDKILKEITVFWNKGEKFKFHGFLHRRGYLLHGPAGSGKTCLVQQIIADIVNADGLVFQCTNHPSVFNDGLSNYRKVEPDRPVVCLFEDIDAIVDEYGEDEILTLLDGENQIDKVLNIATTNYPEKLDPRLIARPRRFDRVMEIDMPPDKVRKMYFEKKLKIDGHELRKWVGATEGFSFAACAELVISVMCFEMPFDDAVERLREMTEVKVTSKDYKKGPKGFEGGVGFAKKSN
jgi:SpoVK/Ycf46/Vps4 family AAA+-type ATPase